jgi:UDP-GlcNAc:undecaprenyl-phosphate GlcNAc-1-phosphate transferase
MSFLEIFVFATIVSAITTALAVKIFPKIGFLDFPERYNLFRKKLPYPGGLVLLLLSAGIFFFGGEFFVLGAPILILGIISFLDDRKNLPVAPRAIIQIAIATFVFWSGIKINFIGNPFSEFFHTSENFELANWQWLSFVLTVGWIIGLQNAMNFFDGLKGLSVGVSGIGFLTLAILGLIRPELFLDPLHTNLTMTNFYLAGLCFGAFFFFWRGKIILGDTGSQILGFLLAVFSIFSGAKIATILLVLGVPILDAFVVTFRRVFIQRKSPFQGDLSHIHHNLSRRIGENKAVILLLFLSAILGAIAIFFTHFEKMIALLTAFSFVLVFDLWASRRKQ